jgi:hypothetical protein
VAVPVHQSFGAWRDFDVEDSDGFVFEGQVMSGLGGARKGIGVSCRKLEEQTVGASRKLIASKVSGVNSR